ncbi:MAG TPA: type II secretion system protein GspC [Kofleriaceae bacterium]|nr:type II secretion system protein GspC [Kofleriaceae bacterium]
MLGRALHHLVTAFFRRTWPLTVMTVFVCAAFAARGAASLLDASVPEPSPPQVSAPHPVSAPVTAARAKDGNAFAERNMFCSSCAPLVAAKPGSTDSFVPDAVLIATSLGDEPYATLLVRSNQAQGSWGVGDRVPGLGTIQRISFVTTEIVDDSGRHGVLSLLESSAGGRGEAGAATPSPTAAGDTAADPYADRLRKIDDSTFEVDRSLVRELVGGSMSKAGARIMPQTDKTGALDGLKLTGVKPGGLASRLGLQNADILQAVNNQKIESANTLLAMYAQLDTMNNVEIAGTRRGKPLTITLRLR